MGHLLSYSLSGGHDGAMLPINPRGLNGPLTGHFIFFLPHVFFTKYTNTSLISNAKLIKWVVERLWYTKSKWSYDLMIFKISLASLPSWKVIPGGDHAWPAWVNPTGHSSQQSMETGWTADSWCQCVCWALPCWELGAYNCFFSPNTGLMSP